MAFNETASRFTLYLIVILIIKTLFQEATHLTRSIFNGGVL